MNKKPVLYLAPLPPPVGGIATWINKIVAHGLPDGRKFAIVNTRLRGKRNVFDKATLSLAEISRNFSILFSLIWQILTKRPKVIHLSCSLTTGGIIRDLACAWLARVFRTPYVLHLHGNIADFNQSRFWGVSGYCLRELLKHASVIIVMNRSSEELATRFPIKGKVVWLPNFIEDQFFTQQAPMHKPQNTRLQAIFAGGITSGKGSLELLATAKKFPEIDFHLYGKMHADVKEAFTLVPENVKLHGVVPHATLLSAMQASDFLVFPSYSEGFPFTVLEAMALGLPVVATKVGAIPEMIDEAKGGFLVPPRQVPSLIEAIRKLTDDQDMMRVMGAYNKDKCFQQFRYSQVVGQLTEIYNAC